MDRRTLPHLRGPFCLRLRRDTTRAIATTAATTMTLRRVSTPPAKPKGPIPDNTPVDTNTGTLEVDVWPAESVTEQVAVNEPPLAYV